MKANFKINKIDSSNNDSSESNNDQNQIKFDEYIKSLPKGWNLWSIRNNSNK